MCCCWNPPRAARHSLFRRCLAIPSLALPAERLRDLSLVLQSAGVTRAHIHHLMSMDVDVRALLHRLGIPFDVTVHDYFAICPQVNLLSWMQGAYCGEPPPAGCNACIADRSSHGARDIVSWRRGNAWQFLEADRVICPSEDVRDRLARYGLDRRAIVVPHEPVAAGSWTLSPPALAQARQAARGGNRRAGLPEGRIDGDDRRIGRRPQPSYRSTLSATSNRACPNRLRITSRPPASTRRPNCRHCLPR